MIQAVIVFVCVGCYLRYQDRLEEKDTDYNEVLFKSLGAAVLAYLLRLLG